MINANLGCLLNVSIPSNGSIQFLPRFDIVTSNDSVYVSIPSNGSIQFLLAKDQMELKLLVSLNPLKRVNSILTTVITPDAFDRGSSLNPLKRVNSILTK